MVAAAPQLAPGLDPVSMLVELGDPGIDVPVADVDVVIRIPRDVGRTVEGALAEARLRLRDSLVVEAVVPFRPPAQVERHSPGGARRELDDRVGRLVDGPEVVV